MNAFHSPIIRTNGRPRCFGRPASLLWNWRRHPLRKVMASKMQRLLMCSSEELSRSLSTSHRLSADARGITYGILTAYLCALSFFHFWLLCVGDLIWHG